MERNNNGVIEIDLLKLIQLLLSKFYIILLCALLGGSALFAYSYYLIAPTYQSSVLIYVNNSNISIGSSLSISAGDISSSRSLVTTYAAILMTRNTLNTVIQKADLDYSYEDFSKMISADSVNDTEIIEIDVVSTSAEEAALIANTIADVFPDKVSSIVNGTSAKIVDYGIVNPQKIAPSNAKNALIGAFVGAILACGVIFIQFMLDDTFRDEEFLTTTFDVPVLAVVPDLAEKKGDSYYSRYYSSYGSYGYGKQPDKKDKKEKTKEDKKEKAEVKN